MRRVALVSAGAEGDAALAWLETLPGVKAARFTHMGEVPLEVTDLVWAHGPVRPVARSARSGAGAALREWLCAGGRLLATLDAVMIPLDLKLETVRPDDVIERVWRHDDDEFWLDEYRSFQAFPHVRGMGAFGTHPLFAGLAQGTYVWAPSEGEAYRWRTYVAARPAAAGIVAVERSFIHLNPGRVVAWEYTMGDGGILCLGAFVYLTAKDDLLARQLRAVLANAVAGDAVPHSERAVPVSLWPGPGVAVAQDIHVPVPAAPDLGEGGGSETPSALAIDLPVTADDPWTHAGRRILMTGGERSGLREAWCHPFRLMGDATLRSARTPRRPPSAPRPRR